MATNKKKWSAAVFGVLLGLLLGFLTSHQRLARAAFPQFPAASGGGGAVSSVTGSNNLSCSPTTGAVVCSGAAFATSASLATVATSGSAADLATGTLAAARMPALTGDCTTSAGAVATSCANATTSTHGMMAAADKVTVNDAAADWCETQWVFAKATISALGHHRCFPANFGLATTGPSANTANIDGGGINSPAGASKYWQTTTVSNPKTKHYFFGGRVKMLGPTAASVNWLGLINAAHSHILEFGYSYTVSTTNFVMSMNNATMATSTTAATSNVIDMAIGLDTTNATLYINEAAAGATQAVSVIGADEPLAPWIYNTNAGDMTITDYFVAWE